MEIPKLSANFSGVVIDQNASPGALLNTGSKLYYQTFRLPEDYKRGTTATETNIPGLSGFQLQVNIESGKAAEASLEYFLEQYIFGEGWSPITKGTITGSPADGERVWIDVYFSKEIPISESQIPDPRTPQAPTEFRIGFKNLANVENVWYNTPDPYAHGAAFQEDGKTSIVPGTETIVEEGIEFVRPKKASFNFRILGLTADAGIDFLGDPYRSVATVSSSSAPAGENTNSGYWQSSPQPSKFAVVSHYSDMRPFPTVPRYGVINRVPNPSFEWDIPGHEPAIWGTENSYWTQPGAALKVIRWREEWVENESYGENESVIYKERGYVSVAKDNRGNNPEAEVPGGPYLFWEPATNVFAPPEGIQYCEVKTEPENPAVITKTSGTSWRVVFHAHLFGRAGLTKEVFASATQGAYINGIPVGLAAPQTFSVWVRTNGTAFKATLGFGTTATGAASEEIEITNEWKRVSVTLTPTASGNAPIAIIAKGKRTFFIDGAMVNSGTKAANYIDGDQKSCIWENVKGRSGSIELIEPEVEGDAAVVDAILVDPITPGVSMNVYYSNDLAGSETGEPTIEQWEQKLWTRSEQSYVLSTKQTIYLPKPIVAKFIKLEFSLLQARSYNPGEFQKPVIYKKFPEWVSEIFLNLLESPDFVAQKVGVSYDALELGYDYYLGDLKSRPVSPLEKPVQEGPKQGEVDPETLAKINLSLNTFTKPPASIGKKGELLGAKQRAEALKQTNYPVEGLPGFSGPTSFPVSTLDRTALILDAGFPIMYFPVTCRHEYLEEAAEFENKRAYFAGLKEVAFIREAYTVQNDGEHYIETGGDNLNAERQDFVVEEGQVQEKGWFAYAQNQAEE